ncbi:hypothetical protein ZWY2020_046915 [Hordeum vulgare]|nr:hypothetical protein ZWY2020_046915 [Hordeum vulgare]
MATRFSAAALPLLLGFLLLRGAPSRAADPDTVAVGRPLSGGRRLVSKRGKFALGFFQPAGSSQSWYLGIWYNQISKHTTVWVANRDAPVSDPASSQLSISSDGNMVLLHGDPVKSPVLWSTDVAGIASRSTVGVLLDTGNLVLTDASNTSVVLWQSFDHFGDTWLPGGKLGRNKRTGEVTRLFAWKGYDDPAPGVFALELDPNGTSQYLLNWNGSMEYWTSGNWTEDGFTGVPELKAYSNAPNSQYKFGYVDGEDGSYFFYDVKDEAVVTRFLVDVTGQIKFLTWVESAGEWILFWTQPKAQCDVYALCGAFAACVENELPSCRCLRGFRERRPLAWLQGDHAEGCVRDTALQQCGRGGGAQGATRQTKNDDGFYSMPNVRLPSDARGVAAAATARDCEVACLGDCFCTAYSYNGSCWLWHGGLVNLQSTSSTGTGGGSGTILIRLAASELTGTGRTKTLIIALAVVAAAVAAVTVAVLVSVFVLRRRRVKAQRRVVEGSLMAFTYRDMQSVTNNFSDKLGGGSFGSVFKGSLPDATATLVAVKKLEGVRQGEKQFRAEWPRIYRHKDSSMGIKDDEGRRRPVASSGSFIVGCRHDEDEDEEAGDGGRNAARVSAKDSEEGCASRHSAETRGIQPAAAPA